MFVSIKKVKSSKLHKTISSKDITHGTITRLGCISGHTPDPDFTLIANSNLNQDNSLAFLITSFSEPTTYKQAMQASDADKWMEAMKTSQSTYQIVSLPPGCKAIGSCWVY